MRNIIILFVLMFSFGVVAQDNNDDNIFSDGEEFEFERFSNESIMVQIDQEAQVACNRGVCTLTAVNESYQEFSVQFNLGEGNVPGWGSYGNGTNINIGENDPDAPRDFWGVSVKFEVGNCNQKIKVPKSLYYAINRYLYGLLNEDGSTRRGFTPADEAMILFYTTIMSHAKGCSGGGR